MNNAPPNKWIVLIQWIVGLQWFRLVYETFTAGVFHESTRTTDSIDAIAKLPGYDTILPPDIINYAAILTNTFFYGSIAIGAILLLGGAWMLLHKPLRVRPVTLTIVVLILGMLLQLIMYTVYGDASALIRHTSVLMGLLQGVLVLYYLVFRRYKKHNHGTNLHYSTVRGID